MLNDNKNMHDYSVPWRVSVLTKVFHWYYPLYRLIYFIYKKISDRQLITALTNQLKQKKSPVVLDVGANVGFYSRLFAQSTNCSARIFAFEPDETNLLHLRNEVKRLPCVQVVPCAVAESDKVMTFFLSPNSSIDHHLVTETIDHKESKLVSVNAISIDNFCKELPAIDLIKMDIQGGEYLALQGMKATIARSSNIMIFMELWPWGFRRTGHLWSDFIELVEELNLQIDTMNGSDPVEYCKENVNNMHKYTNICLTHK